MGEWQETNPDDLLAGPMAEAYLKKRLREKLRRRMEESPPGDNAAVVREVAIFLSERAELKVVALFAALPGEVDLRTLPGEITRVWVFPRVEGGDLVFHEVRDMDKDLERGAYGIMEPNSKLRRVMPDEVDVFLCPGLGFDPKGGRLGRGKGFYDRMLQGARVDAVKLGVCFGYQMVDGIVMEEHDVRMDGVIAG